MNENRFNQIKPKSESIEMIIWYIVWHVWAGFTVSFYFVLDVKKCFNAQVLEWWVATRLSLRTKALMNNLILCDFNETAYYTKINELKNIL